MAKAMRRTAGNSGNRYSILALASGMAEQRQTRQEDNKLDGKTIEHMINKRQK